jgi:hypothetical protein
MPWDWGGPPLAILDGSAVAAILRRHAAGELSDEQVVHWANLVEVREDVESTPEAKDAVFSLSNPAINGALSEVAPMLLSQL